MGERHLTRDQEKAMFARGYVKTNKYALIKNNMSGGEHTRAIYKKGNKRYIKNYNRYIPLNRMNVVATSK